VPKYSYGQRGQRSTAQGERAEGRPEKTSSQRHPFFVAADALLTLDLRDNLDSVWTSQRMSQEVDEVELSHGLWTTTNNREHLQLSKQDN